MACHAPNGALRYAAYNSGDRIKGQLLGMVLTSVITEVSMGGRLLFNAKAAKTSTAAESVSRKIRVQKQNLEHTIGGERRILKTDTFQNRVYVEYDGVKGFYNNNGTVIETNKFMIKGKKSATVVSVHPNSTY